MIDLLCTMFTERAPEILQWMEGAAQGLPLPFYTSADLRDSGVKAACVDLNMFPAGFNNLCETFTARSVHRVGEWLEQRFDGAPHQRVLIVPEAHTRNLFYNSNVKALCELLTNAGLQATVAALAVEGEPLHSALTTFDGQTVPVLPVRRAGARIVGANGEMFDWILLNNDLATGAIEWLRCLDQPVIPPMCLGWHRRRKSVFFECYGAVVEEFAKAFSLDPWLLSTCNDVVTGVDFSAQEGLERVAISVTALLERIQRKYDEYKVKRAPQVFVKNNAGTYGMGIMVVKSVEDVLTMNRRAKNKMATGKGGVPIHEVLLQEAIPTRTRRKDVVTEPVVYMIGTNVIGMFLRANPERGDVDNLNAKGMTFYRYCSLQPGRVPEECVCTSASQALYNVLSQLAVIAAARESVITCG